MIVLTVMAVYIVFSIFIGVSGSRGEKTTRSFFVSHGNLNYTLLIPLLFGELIAGAGTVGNASGAFTTGVSAVWGVWGQALGCVIFVVFVSGFFYNAGKQGAMSVAEAFEYRFDKRVRTAVSLVVLIAFLIVYAMQPAAIAGILEPLTGISRLPLLIGCTILFVIMALMGLKGIAKMNLVHSLLIFSVLMIIAVCSFSETGGGREIIKGLPESYFNLFLPDLSSSLANILGASFAMISAATVVNSCYCAKSLSDARKGILFVAGAIFVFATFPVIIGMSGRIVFPEANPDSIIYIMAEEISPVFSSLAGIAICASVLSTAPALLLMLSATVTRDLYCIVRKDASDKEQLLFSKIIIIVIAVIGIALSFGMESILNEWLASFQIRAIVGIVIVISIYWKKVTNTAAFWAIIVGGILAAVWHYMDHPFGVEPIWPSVFIGIFLVIALSVARPEKRK